MQSLEARLFSLAGQYGLDRVEIRLCFPNDFLGYQLELKPVVFVHSERWLPGHHVLPTEQRTNPYVDLEQSFNHFYARKVMLVKASEGFVLFEGGFGTLDELFESLVLLQTGKILHFPVVLFGREHWRPLTEWINGPLVERGLISPGDLELISVTDDPDEAVETILACVEHRCSHHASLAAG